MHARLRYGLEKREQPVASEITAHYEWLSISVICFVGVLLRLFSPAMKSDLWYDEVCSFVVASQPFGRMMRVIYLGADTNPPLYTFLLHFWIKLGNSDTSVKLFSLMFATASTIVLYKLARQLAGRYVAMLSSCLFTASPSVITYSVEARPYAIFLFLSLLSTYSLLSTLQEAKRPQTCQARSGRLWLGYCAASTLLLYTHWFGLLVLAAQAVALVAYSPSSFRFLRPYLNSLLLIAGCCLPLILLLRNQLVLQNSVGGYSWPGKPGLRVLTGLGAFLAGGENPLALILLLLVAAIIANRAISQFKRNGGSAVLFLLSYAALPVVVVFAASNLLTNNSFFVNRYFLPFIISINILSGLALSRLNKRLACAFLLLFWLFPLGTTVKHWRVTETQYSQAASELAAHASSDALIAHLSPMSYYPLLHYRRKQEVTERILFTHAGTGYETAYNLEGEMLNSDDLIQAGDELHKYLELWLIIDSTDKDAHLSEAYERIRSDGNFILESTKQIRSLRLEHYRLRSSGPSQELPELVPTRT